MYVHRLGFDPSFARYSPGLVNTLDTIETAAAEGLTRVEFLGGAERYKLELADRLDPLCQGIGLARGPLARAVVASRLAYIRLRLRLKRARPASTALRRRRRLPSGGWRRAPVGPSAHDRALSEQGARGCVAR